MDNSKFYRNLVATPGQFKMPRTVHCVVLKEEAEGLEKPPYPGELGQRIFETVSAEGWKQWLERLVLIINENQISTADPESIDYIEQHMRGFLFGEGDLGQVPEGFQPRKK
jgi:Fe-S cluster biosynthesis and repair protein YggX